MGERKIKGLLRCGAVVRLVARDLTPWLALQDAEGRITYVGMNYEEAALEDVDLVFAVTNDPVLNGRIAVDARRHRVWCNMATDPELGTFIVPSVFERGPLTVAVSTAGQSPALARLIREQLEDQFGPEWSLFLDLMGLLRRAIQAKGLESSENQRLFREVARLPLPEWIGKKRSAQIVKAVYHICSPCLTFDEVNQLWDEAWKNSSSSLQRCATVAAPLDT